MFAETGWALGDFQFLLSHIASILDPGQKGCVEDPKVIKALTQNGNTAALYFLASASTNPPAGFSSAYTYSVAVQWTDVQPPSASFTKGQFQPGW